MMVIIKEPDGLDYNIWLGLTNDNEAEVFPLRYTYDDLVIYIIYAIYRLNNAP